MCINYQVLILFNDVCLARIEELYCFLYKSNTDELSKSAGWDSFNLEKEYKRMNVPNESWSVTTLNQDYEVDNCHFYLITLFLFLF